MNILTEALAVLGGLVIGAVILTILYTLLLDWVISRRMW